MADTKTLEQTAVQLLNEIVAALKAIAGPAMDLAVTTMRLSSIGDIAVGFVLLLITCALIWWDFRLYKSAKTEEAKYPNRVVVGEAQMACMIPISILALTTAVGSVVYLLDKWNWIGAFAPEVRLAHEVIEKIL